MNPSLHHLITERGFDTCQTDLEARLRLRGLECKIQYSENSANPSLTVRLESKDRLVEICAKENGECDLMKADLNNIDGIRFTRHDIKNEQDFHDRFGELYRYVVHLEDINGTRTPRPSSD